MGVGVVISEQGVRKRGKRPSTIWEVVAPQLAFKVCDSACVRVRVCVNAFQQQGHLGLNPQRSPQSDVKGYTSFEGG